MKRTKNLERSCEKDLEKHLEARCKGIRALRERFGTPSQVAGGSKSALRRDDRLPPFFKTFVQFCLRFGRLPFTLRVFARSCAPMFSPCSHLVVAYFGGVLKFPLDITMKAVSVLKFLA